MSRLPGIVILFLITCLSVQAQKQSNRSGAVDTVTTMEGSRTIYTIGYKTGGLKEVLRFRDGRKDGWQETYYPGGQLSEKIFYKNGFPDGEWITYDNQGKLKELKHYKFSKALQHSLLDGGYEKYGNKMLILKTVYKDSLKSGSYEEYNPDGKLKTRATYKNDLLTGLKEDYNNKGILSAKVYYTVVEENGKPKSVLDGPVLYYNYDGFLTMEGVYSKGNKEGTWKEYNTKGVLQNETTYKNNKIHGPVIRYFENGLAQSKWIYYAEIEVSGQTKKNVYDGNKTEYYKNGKLSKMENYRMGSKEGTWESHYENGILRDKTSFVDNRQIGLLQSWDTSGNKNYEVTYKIIKEDTSYISVKDGPELRWEKNVLIFHTVFREGKEEGIRKSYYKSGKLMSEAVWSEGMPQGIQTEFYENGIVKSRKDFRSTMDSAKKRKTVDSGWSFEYDSSGHDLLRQFSDTAGNRLVRKEYVDGVPAKLYYHNILDINYFPNGKLMSLIVHGSRNASPLGYYYYLSGHLRKIAFQNPVTRKDATIELSDNGEVLNVYFDPERNTDAISPGDTLVSEIVTVSGNRLIQDRFITDTTKNGSYELHYANGSVMAQLEFENDVPNGTIIFFDAFHGDTLLNKTFDHGRQVGYYLEKFAGKTVTSRGELPSSEASGWEEIYRPDGIPVRKSLFTDQKHKSREVTEYYDNGRIKSVQNYENSTSAYFDTSGYLVSETIPVQDSAGLRMHREFYPGSKQLKSMSYTKNDKPDSTHEFYYPSGKLDRRLHYRQGKREGRFEKYDESGNIRTSGIYINDQQEGLWITVKDNKTDSMYYLNNKLQVKPSELLCSCIDTVHNANAIRFVPTLRTLVDYPILKSYFAKFIKPIDSLNYESLFYSNLQTDNNRDAGFASFSLVMFKEFAMYLPADEQLKLIFNPCRTKGYYSKMDMYVNYYPKNIQETRATLVPQRVCLEIRKGPVRSNSKDHPYFNVLFNTENIEYDMDEKLRIKPSKTPDYCFVPGIVKNYLTFEIRNAVPVIFESPRTVSKSANWSGVDVKEEEVNTFFGLFISDASVRFMHMSNAKPVYIQANSDFMLAGGKYVAGRISFPCIKTGTDKYLVSQNKEAIVFTSQELKIEWLKNGFSRLNFDYNESSQIMNITFFAE